MPTTLSEIQPLVQRAIDEQPVWDMHTHLYPQSFGTPEGGASGESDPDGLLLWGIDDLLTYHYLVAEVFRAVPARKLPYQDFWRMTKQQQADHIWRELFVERSPLSEACRGVVTTLHQLGLEPGDKDLAGYRKWFAAQDPSGHIDRVMEVANVSRITMTNDVFDDNERARWLADPGVGSDPRFAPVLRFDPLIRDWPETAKKLTEWGYPAKVEIDATSIESARRFLREWLERTGAIYSAVSLGPEFRYGGQDDQSPGSVVLREVVMPVLADEGQAFAMMIGVTRGLNPAIRMAGDMLGMADVNSVMTLCRDFPENRFFCTMLARENQHELAVAARKFGNLMVFGCWWFLNTPSLIEEITRMRIELLGPTFIPQHSDARVIDQLLYKWRHSRQVIAKVLVEKYADLADSGWAVTEEAIRRDVKSLLQGNFVEFLKG
jgi:hypothetical protein